MRKRAVALAAALAIGAMMTLVGCAPTVDLNPAPKHANDPRCADVMVRLPSSLVTPSLTLARRETNAQSTAAWGDPTSVVFSCGVPVVTASSLPCVQIDDDVYWLREKDAKAGVWRFTTFGRDPAVQMTISTKLSPGAVLDLLDSKLQFLPTTGRVCSSTEDTVTGEALPSESPTPVPSTTPTP